MAYAVSALYDSVMHQIICWLESLQRYPLSTSWTSGGPTSKGMQRGRTGGEVGREGRGRRQFVLCPRKKRKIVRCAC